MGSEAANIPIWSIEYWSNLSNLVGVFILGAAVPVATRILKKWEKMREEKRKALDEHTMKLITGVTTPMEKKMDEVERTNTALLSQMNKFMTSFDDYVKEQRDVNARVNYLDKIIQDNIRFGEYDGRRHDTYSEKKTANSARDRARDRYRDAGGGYRPDADE